jgi:hypothetical protein
MERSIPVRAGSSGIQVINQSNSSTVRDDSGGPGVVKKIDASLYNDIINDLWFHEDLDCMENFPNDFSDDYIIRSFSKRLSADHIQDWISWKVNYVAMYD